MKSETPTTFSPGSVCRLGLGFGLLTGFGEGANAYLTHSPVWQEVLRAALIVNVLLFAGLALALLILTRFRRISRSLLVRAAIAFGFLMFYNWSNGWVRTTAVPWPYLISVSLALGLAAVFSLYLTQCLKACQWISAVLAVAAVTYCLLLPMVRKQREARAASELPPGHADGRNVVLIIADTVRADHLSAYGYFRDTSPNLSRLSRQGVQFANAIAPSSWTLPSHASLLSGLYPHDHHADLGGSNFDSRYPNIATSLEQRGYRTGAFSANTGNFSRERGFGHGFLHFDDEFATWGLQFGATFYGEKIVARLCQVRVLRDLPGRLTAQDINQHALAWIDADKSRPFFAVLNYYDAHDPYLPPEPFLHRYTNVKHPSKGYTPHWESFDGLTLEERQSMAAAYDGAINYIDEEIGQLVQALSARGLVSNTDIVITSDHGEGFYEHQLMNHGNSLYREVIHVPLIIWGPGVIPALSSPIDYPVSLTAIPATILDLAKVPESTEFHQPSLKPLWEGEGAAFPIAPAISELAQLPWNRQYPNYYGPMRSITTSHWQYIVGGNSGEQLFQCCGSNGDLNLASTAEGKRVCEKFRQELRATSTTQSKTLNASAIADNQQKVSQ